LYKYIFGQTYLTSLRLDWMYCDQTTT
jgi:hypothetical protein